MSEALDSRNGDTGDGSNHFRSPRAVVDTAIQKVKSQLSGRPEYRAGEDEENYDDEHQQQQQQQQQHSSLNLEEVDIDVEDGNKGQPFLNRNPLFAAQQQGSDQLDEQQGGSVSLVARKVDWGEERSEGGESSSSKRSAASSVLGKCVPSCCKRHALKIFLMGFAVFIISLAVAFGLK